MQILNNAFHRFCLRMVGGRSSWHRRYYRPDVNVVEATNRLWFEQGGRVAEALPVAALQGKLGGRCNLLLSGPSVKTIENPRRLAQCDWFGVNGSPALFGEHTPKMRVYHVNDTTFVRGSLETFLRFSAKAEYTVIDYRSMYELLRLIPDRMPDTQLVIYDNWSYPHRLPLGTIERVSGAAAHRGIYWSDDLGLGLATGGTVAYTAAQLAFHGGYQSLYIYGLDLTNTGRSYEEQRAHPQMLDKAFEAVIVPAFELMASKTAGRLDVHNCNPNSRLPAEILPRLDPEASLVDLGH